MRSVVEAGTPRQGQGDEQAKGTRAGTGAGAQRGLKWYQDAGETIEAQVHDAEGDDECPKRGAGAP